jgi:hypothetical protein
MNTASGTAIKLNVKRFLTNSLLIINEGLEIISVRKTLITKIKMKNRLIKSIGVL